MNGHGWKEYLTFTKKERTGVIVLLALIMIIYAVPEFFPDGPSLEVFYHNDSLNNVSNNKSIQEEPDRDASIAPREHDPNKYDDLSAVSARFEFDPNTLPENGWKQLGVPERTIKTIMNFREKGGKFREPEDLRKIYGLKRLLCDELIPYVRIRKLSSGTFSKKVVEKFDITERQAGKFKPKIYQGGNDFRTDSGFYRERPRKYSGSINQVDINTADSASWERLPGIGGKLASRIILFRERLGGFYSVRQVAETFGLSDSTFKMILPYLSCGETALRKTNINGLTAPELARHPYLRWTLANAIVNYRNQHGSFRSVSDLRSVTAIPADVLEKLQPYLSVE